MATWKLTVRDGSTVRREGFDDLDEAISRARAETERIVARGPTGGEKAIRDYDAAEVVRARIEISGKGLIRPPTAGLDVQGDLSLVGFIGGIGRRRIEATDLDGILGEVREALAG